MVLGLLLVLLSGAAVVLLAAYNRSGGPDYSVNLFDNEIFVANGMQVFFAGIVLALTFCLGLWLMAAGARRRRAMRAEIRAARNDARSAEMERDRLAHANNGPRYEPHDAPTETVAVEQPRRRFFNRHHEEEHTTTPAAPTPTTPAR